MPSGTPRSRTAVSLSTNWALCADAKRSGASGEQIVDLQMHDLRDRLADRRITLAIREPARVLIVRAGYDPVYGARPLRRYIQQHRHGGRVIFHPPAALTAAKAPMFADRLALRSEIGIPQLAERLAQPLFDKKRTGCACACQALATWPAPTDDVPIAASGSSGSSSRDELLVAWLEDQVG
jgi:hypothetical protein